MFAVEAYDTHVSLIAPKLTFATNAGLWKVSSGQIKLCYEFYAQVKYSLEANATGLKSE